MKNDEYSKHLAYCGSKTKKCPDCARNVMQKDQDSHSYGGECQAFKEEDKLTKELEEKKKKNELLRKE